MSGTSLFQCRADIAYKPGPAAACIGDATEVNTAISQVRRDSREAHIRPTLYSAQIVDVDARVIKAFSEEDDGFKCIPAISQNVEMAVETGQDALHFGTTAMRFVLTPMVPIGWDARKTIPSHAHSGVSAYGFVNLLSLPLMAELQGTKGVCDQIVGTLANVSLDHSTSHTISDEYCTLATHLYPLTNGAAREQTDYGVVSVTIATAALKALHVQVLGDKSLREFAESTTNALVNRRLSLLKQPYLGIGGEEYYKSTMTRVEKAFQALPANDIAGKNGLIEFSNLQTALWKESEPFYTAAVERCPCAVDISKVTSDVWDVPSIDGPVSITAGMTLKPGSFVSDDVAEEVSRRFLMLGAAVYCGTADEDRCKACVDMFLVAAQKQLDDIVSEKPSDRPLASTVDFTAEILQYAIAEAPWKYRADAISISSSTGKNFMLPVESMNNAMEVSQTISTSKQTVNMTGADCEDCAKGETTFVITIRNHISSRPLPCNDALKQLFCLYAIPMTALASVNASHIGAMDNGETAEGLHCIGTMVPQTLFTDALCKGDAVSRAYANAKAGASTSLQEMFDDDPLTVVSSDGVVYHTSEIGRRLSKNWPVGLRMGPIVIEGTDMSPYCGNLGMFSVKHADGSVSEPIYRPDMSRVQQNAVDAAILAKEVDIISSTGIHAQDDADGRTRFLASRWRKNDTINALQLPMRAPKCPNPRRDSSDFYRSLIRLYLPATKSVVESGADHVVMQLRVGTLPSETGPLQLSADIHDFVNGALNTSLAFCWLEEEDIRFMRGVTMPQFTNPAVVITGPGPKEALDISPMSSQIMHALRTKAPAATAPVAATSHYDLTNLNSNSTTLVLAHTQEVWECSMMYSVAVFIQSLAKALPSAIKSMEPLSTRLAVEKPTNHKLFITVDTEELLKSRSHIASFQTNLGGSLAALYQTRDIRAKEVAMAILVKGKLRESTAHQGGSVPGLLRMIENAESRGQEISTTENSVSLELEEETAAHESPAPVDSCVLDGAAESVDIQFDGGNVVYDDSDDSLDKVIDALIMEPEIGSDINNRSDNSDFPSSDSESDDEGVSNQAPTIGWSILRKMPSGSHHTNDGHIRYFQNDIADSVVQYLVSQKPIASTTFTTANICDGLNTNELKSDHLLRMYVIANGKEGQRIHSLFDELRTDMWSINQSAYDTISSGNAVMSACIRE